MVRSERKRQLTDAQVLEKIGNALEGAQKTTSLAASVFVFSAVGLILVVSAPAEFRGTATAWALAHWTMNLIWTVIAGFGWRTLTDSESSQLSQEERARRLRLQAIWFHSWKGGFALLLSALLLFVGLGLFKHLGSLGWADGLAVGAYGLTCVFSLWQRQRICYTKLVGWSSDTPWGRLMLRIAAVTPAAAWACAAVAIVLARLEIVPRSIAAGFFGSLSTALACVIVPQAVYDFAVARIHLQVYRTGTNQRLEKDRQDPP